MLTLGWHVWHPFAGLAAPLAYGVPPITQPLPESDPLLEPESEPLLEGES